MENSTNKIKSYDSDKRGEVWFTHTPHSLIGTFFTNQGAFRGGHYYKRISYKLLIEGTIKVTKKNRLANQTKTHFHQGPCVIRILPHTTVIIESITDSLFIESYPEKIDNFEDKDLRATVDSMNQTNGFSQ